MDRVVCVRVAKRDMLACHTGAQVRRQTGSDTSPAIAEADGIEPSELMSSRAY